MIEFKNKIVQEILKNLESERQVMLVAAKEAREAATHEESKAEDKYDTRGLEASYLAGAQAKRAAELDLIIHSFRSLEVKSFDNDSRVATTALVEVQTKEKRTLFFLAPKEGGMLVQVEGKSIQVLTPESKMGRALIGRSRGDLVEIQIPSGTNDYEILEVY